MALFFGFAIGLTPYWYGNHNSYHKGKDKEVARKLDGIFSNTTVTILDGEGSNITPKIDIDKYFYGTLIGYSDFDGDYVDDRIYENTREVSAGSLYNRNEDLEEYSAKFKTADRDFIKQITRFEPLFKKDKGS